MWLPVRILTAPPLNCAWLLSNMAPDNNIWLPLNKVTAAPNEAELSVNNTSPTQTTLEKSCNPIAPLVAVFPRITICPLMCAVELL